MFGYGYGVSAAPARESTVSEEEIECIRSPWNIPFENQPSRLPLQPAETFSLGWQAFVEGLGRLLNIFPAPNRGQVYMPGTTAEEDIQEAWNEVARTLCEVTRRHDNETNASS